MRDNMEKILCLEVPGSTGDSPLDGGGHPGPGFSILHAAAITGDKTALEKVGMTLAPLKPVTFL